MMIVESTSVAPPEVGPGDHRGFTIQATRRLLRFDLGNVKPVLRRQEGLGRRDGGSQSAAGTGERDERRCLARVLLRGRGAAVAAIWGRPGSWLRLCTRQRERRAPYEW